jgi:RNA polymerase sigma-70 factor (ECF subfamily)
MREVDNITSIFVALRSSLSRAVQHIVPPKEIEDIVQETYLRVCQQGGDSGIRSPRSFMFKTARNLALDHVKRAENRRTDRLDESMENHQGAGHRMTDGTLDKVCSDEEFSAFCNAVRFLPAQCRRAFVLRKVYGYSQREIASIMKISERTAEKHISNGIRQCMAYMERNGVNYSDDAGHRKPNRVVRARKGGRT